MQRLSREGLNKVNANPMGTSGTPNPIPVMWEIMLLLGAEVEDQDRRIRAFELRVRALERGGDG